VFSRPIFKQTLRANYALWLIFTLILSAVLALSTAIHDQSVISSMMEALKGTALANLAGAKLSGMTTFLGVLSQTFYGMLAVVLPMVYFIITANSLVASEVDRGSMAYTLSTPTRRQAVVSTKAAFLILSLIAMFAVVTATGVLTAQAVHGAVWGTRYTPDVKAAAKVLAVDRAEVAGNLGLILKNEEALTAGAEARKIDKDLYAAYLQLAMERDGQASPASQAAAPADGAQAEAMANALQTKLTTGLAAAAAALNMEMADLSKDLGLLKSNETALAAATAASRLPREAFVSMVNQALARAELTKDVGLDFSLKNFLWMNLGCLLLMFAVSGISFLASCSANLTKNSLAFGAGIPLAFFVFKTVADMGDSLAGFKYATLNSLYDPQAIANGGSFGMQFAVLAVVGLVLYGVGIEVFKRKDLPL